MHRLSRFATFALCIVSSIACPSTDPVTWYETPPTGCSDDAECAGAFTDLSFCEEAACSAGICERRARADGTACDDGDGCTTSSVCQAGACVGETTIVCPDDGNPCTEDLCDVQAGCLHQPTSGGPCDDGDLCTTSDVCQSGTCLGTALVCDDGDPCTTGDACQSGACQPGTPISCGAHATCNVTGACVCAPGYLGDGVTCIPDPCATANGGCHQTCEGSSGVAECGCFPGFARDGNGPSCHWVGRVAIYNVDLGLFLGLDDSGPPPLPFALQASPVPIEMEATYEDPRAFTIQIRTTPGTCSNGAFGLGCFDVYRLCAAQIGDFRWSGLRANNRVGEPSGWYGPACTWRVEDIGGGEVRLKNVWLQEEHPYLDYLDCREADDCTFTLDESTTGNTRFAIDLDECINGSDTCDANATCTNTLGSYTCACIQGYVGDGHTCTEYDACDLNNGGCDDQCTGTAPDGSAICACDVGSALGADGKSCAQIPHRRLYNQDLGLFLGVKTQNSYDYEFLAPGEDVVVGPSAVGGGTATFTIGSYRYCVDNLSGLRPYMAHSSSPDWNNAHCAWTMHDTGFFDGTFRLKNVWVQQISPSVDFLKCDNPADCGFTQLESTAGNTIFRLDTDECGAGTDNCDPAAVCTNTGTGAGFTCACPNGFAGDGFTCVQTDMCVIDNGGCAQTCTTSNGQAVCDCLPGFGLVTDGHSCEPLADARLYNFGLDLFFNLRTNSGWPYTFLFQNTSRSMRIEPAGGAGNAVKITADYTPGTCADGITRPSCTDSYRLCAGNLGGVRAFTLFKSDYTGTPGAWDDPQCVWLLEEAGGNDQVRIKNQWLQQIAPYIDYLDCELPYDCLFTDDEDTSGNTLFAIDYDECLTNTDQCDPHATCTNTIGSYDCVCNNGYAGDGRTCVQTDACVVGNGGCEHSCVGTVNGNAVCDCMPSFTLAGDGRSCVPSGATHLYNVGLDRYMNLGIADVLEWQTSGRNVVIEPTAYGSDIYTFTVYKSPGTCANGSTSPFCPNAFRMCAYEASGFRWTRYFSNAYVGEPSGWNGPECAWKVVPAGGDDVRLKNLWLQQTYDYVDYLDCTVSDCTFQYDESTAGNTLFRFSVDECTAGTDTCDANATCTNTPTGYGCACKNGFAGDGFTCVQTDACVTNNGGCAQRCVGTTAGGAGICDCFDGFTLAGDGHACTPWSAVSLYNVGLTDFLGLRTITGPPYTFDFDATGDPVHIVPAGGPNLFSINIDASPGQCADGSIRQSCTDHYRVCAQEHGGFRWKTLRQTVLSGVPPGWDAPACTWILEPAGGGQMRFKNLWLQQTYPYVDYLDCHTNYDCVFTQNESTAGNTLFQIDPDECSARTDTCDVNATCTNTVGGYDCTCKSEFTGDGHTCTPLDPCATSNGGCDQMCSTAPNGSAACACNAGFTLEGDGHTCTPWADGVRLYNIGLAAFLNVLNPGTPPGALRFMPASAKVAMEPTAYGPDIFTFTLDSTPGACGDGTVSSACVDSYRLCARQLGGYTWYGARKSAHTGTPAEWSAPECAWKVEPVGHNQVRLENLWLEQTAPYVDYLDCGLPYDCGFTYDGSIAGNVDFVIDRDECAEGTDTCDANATCTNAASGYTCACNDGYYGDGRNCAPTNECVVQNGGCEQICTGTAIGHTCACFPGFALSADGASCDPVGDVQLFNAGIGGFLNVSDIGNPPHAFRLAATGLPVRMEPTADGRDVFTFTVDYRPGTCANGATSIGCVDSYRLCAEQYGGFHWTERVSNAIATSIDWDTPACKWKVELAGGDEVRLKNLWLQQTTPYVDYLSCAQTFDCFFTYDDSTAGNTIFVVDVDECAAGTDTCDPHATCTNTSDGYSCACNTGFTGNGFTCTPNNACVIANGGCAQQCADIGGTASCSCLPGFTLNADQHGCDATGAISLHNVGLDLFLGLFVYGDPPYPFELAPSGAALDIEPTADGPNTFTLTVAHAADNYRLCAQELGGFHWYAARQSAATGTPPEWNAPECTWIIEPAGGDQVRLKNLWLQETFPYVDYLNCVAPYDCVFNYDEDLTGNTLFTIAYNDCANGTALCSSLRGCLNAPSGYTCTDCPAGYTNDGAYDCQDVNECALNSDNCDTNAGCSNTTGGFTCACNGGYQGDGVTCIANNACTVSNGGCSARCADVGGAPSCSCYPGFDLAGDGTSCTAWSSTRLINEGLSLFLGSLDGQQLRFTSSPRAVRIEPVSGRNDTFTITVDYTPGTCANGSTSPGCVDALRLCAGQASGFRMVTLESNAQSGLPVGWDGPACQWIVESLGGDQIRLKNLWLQQTLPYVDYLSCWDYHDCVFTYFDATAGNTIFRVSPGSGDLCGGVTCAAVDACHVAGGCDPATGLCTNPEKPNGTSCSDGNPSTTGDSCSNGVCIGGGDRDADGVSDSADHCIGDDALGDGDNDGFCQDSDNCPSVSNANQADTDLDGIGNACDNCPAKASVVLTDADQDGIGDVCDPDYVLPPTGTDPPDTYNGGNPARPTCGFVPKCPDVSGATRFNSYRFECYPDEPSGGDLCLGDRWWYHMDRRIFPMMVGTQSTSTVDGILDELTKPEYNASFGACTTAAQCPAGVDCTDGSCIPDPVLAFMDRVSQSASFLSCTGASSYENTWPSDRVTILDTGGCSAATFHQRAVYGYRVVNTTLEPMAFWVGKGSGDGGKRWWTVNPGEEIRFNVLDGAKFFPTTAAAYNVCMPGLMLKTVQTANLSPSHVQVSPVELVRYDADETELGGGSFILYRDKELRKDFDLFAYPNYFGVGLAPKGNDGGAHVSFYRYLELQCF